MPDKSASSASKPFQSTLERSPEHVTAIGMISIELANLEIVLGELLGAMLHILPDFGSLIYLTPKANLARLDILDNVANATFEPKRAHRMGAEKIIKTAKSVMGKRHQFIHGAWGVSKSNLKEVHLRPLPFQESKGSRPVPISEIEEDIDKIRKLIDEVRNFTLDLYREWPPYTLPEIHRAQDIPTEWDPVLIQPDTPQEPQDQPEASEE